MKAYEVRASRGGAAAVSWSPALGACIRGVPGPLPGLRPWALGLQAQGIFVYQNQDLGPSLAHPPLRLAQAWLLVLFKGLRALFWFKSFFVDELPPWLLEVGPTVPHA